MVDPLDVPDWDPGLSVGDDYIDAQHRMLFYLIALLREALASDDAQKRTLKVLVEVKKYAGFHFGSEENHMVDIGYPDRLEHARIHTRMLVDLADHVRSVEFDSGNANAALRFVENWLHHHVAHEDQKFAKYGQSGPG